MDGVTLLPDSPDPADKPDFRCASASAADGEELAGTAPTEAEWLFVEYVGAWGAKAVRDSRLPEDVREHLAGRPERVHLIRRHGRKKPSDGAPIRVFAARFDDQPRVATALLDSVDDLIGLDVAELTAYEEPLWMVCTNGSRDLCCAERGRPVAAALTQRWPEATWETTHLGGHRFSATLLAVPSGLVLGRLDAESAVTACEEVEAGLMPSRVTRGHVGRSAVAQYAEMHLHLELGLDAVRTTRVDESPTAAVINLTADGEDWVVEVGVSSGEPRRASCADLTLKAAPVHRVLDARSTTGASTATYS